MWEKLGTDTHKEEQGVKGMARAFTVHIVPKDGSKDRWSSKLMMLQMLSSSGVLVGECLLVLCLSGTSGIGIGFIVACARS